MSKIIFILGGARSGKSYYAVKLAKKFSGEVAFIATADAGDLEMKERINLHRKVRPPSWKTFEEPEKIFLVLKKINHKFKVVIIDCLTIWMSNLLLKGYNEKTIEEKINEVLNYLKKTKIKTIIVSNEVGLGIVPKNKLAREFRDITGRINQIVASSADEVFFLVSGLPRQIKGGKK